MKALCVKQPSATLFCEGTKARLRNGDQQEFRTWRPKYRGPLVIVASSQRCYCEECTDLYDASRMPRGVTICTMDLVDVRGDEGDYRWIMRNSRPLKHMKVKGKLMIFDIDDRLVVPA